MPHKFEKLVRREILFFAARQKTPPDVDGWKKILRSGSSGISRIFLYYPSLMGIGR